MATRDGLFKRGRIWWVRKDPLDGVQRSTRCTDFEAARLWRAARERLAADPAYRAAQEATLGEWIKRVIGQKQQAAKAGAGSESTVAYTTTKLGHWVRIFGAECPLAAFSSPELFDAFVAQRRSEEASDHTISKEVGLMLGVLRRAKRGRCFSGDIDTLRPMDLHAGYVPRKRALAREELIRLLAELEPPRAALVAVCVALGCRLSEAFKLLPSDLDFEGSSVFIRGTKTEESERYVPMLSVFRPLLEAARPYLPLAPWTNLRRGLLRACKRAGIAPCTPNDLRRTHASLLRAAGVDRDVVRRLLGHTTPKLVDTVYGQMGPDSLRILAEERLDTVAPIQIRNDPPLALPEAITVPAENMGANFEIRTRDLRFTKPEADPGEKPATSDIAGLERSVSVASDRKPLASDTRTQQSVSAQAWALALAAEAVLGPGFDSRRLHSAPASKDLRHESRSNNSQTGGSAERHAALTPSDVIDTFRRLAPDAFDDFDPEADDFELALVENGARADAAGVSGFAPSDEGGKPETLARACRGHAGAGGLNKTSPADSQGHGVTGPKRANGALAEGAPDRQGSDEQNRPCDSGAGYARPAGVIRGDGSILRGMAAALDPGSSLRWSLETLANLSARDEARVPAVVRVAIFRRRAA